MREAILQFLQYVFMAWCLVKHRDDFTFTLIIIIMIIIIIIIIIIIKLRLNVKLLLCFF
jgi:hypothetical protein